MLSLLFALIFVFYLGKKSKDGGQKLKWVIGTLLILREIYMQYYLHQTGMWDIKTSLPLQMCSFSRIVTIILLFRFNQVLYEFLLLLGMAGAFQSFLTPELTHGDGTIWLLVEYYLGHAVIIVMALYFFFVEKRDIRKRSWLYGYLVGNAFLIFVGIVNYFIGSNYIYLCQKPLANNPLVMGPWPYYLIGFQVFGLIHIYLLYLLFRYLQKKRKQKQSQ